MKLSDVISHLAAVAATANRNRDFAVAMLSQQAITAVSELQYKCRDMGFMEETTNGDELGDYPVAETAGNQP